MSSSRDVEIPFNEITLAGTLHLPDTDPPHPAIVMLHGSGATATAVATSHRYVTASCTPVLRCSGFWDKPGIGASTGDWHQQTFFDRAAESITALKWLRAQPEIDHARTGAWGQSQGGWIVQIVAANDPELAFAIINSGPGINVVEQDLFGVEHTLREWGASDDDLRQAESYMTQIHDAAIASLPYEQFVSDVMEPARNTPGFNYFGEVDEGLWTFLVLNLNHPYEPATALERITCPVLVIFGELDTLVPVAPSVRIHQEALSKAGNRDVTIEVFPGADHRIMIGDPPRFADGYLGTMASWLRERVG